MPYEEILEGWEVVNEIDPQSLVEARLQAHWAAQLLAAVGEALVPPQPDFSHTSMSWSPARRGLVGQSTPKGSTVELTLADLTIHVRGPGGAVVSHALEGHSLSELLDWVVGALEKAEGGSLPRPPEIPGYEMPDHDAGRGGRFGPPDTGRLEELARWYANGARLAGQVSENTLGASPVRIWPHHFDLATLVTLDPPGSDPETARSIGFGLSPGDASYPEPYLYINPWPFPEERAGHSELAGGGHWHTEGWFGAVLPASAVEGPRRAQAEQILAFARSAMAADRFVLGAW